jgi:hypothetical protein
LVSKHPFRKNLTIWLAIFAMMGEAQLFAITVGPWITHTFGTTDNLAILLGFAIVFGGLLIGTAWAIARIVVWAIWKAFGIQS